MRGTPLAGTFCTLFPQEESALSPREGTRFPFRAQGGHEAPAVFPSVRLGAGYPRFAERGCLGRDLYP